MRREAAPGIDLDDAYVLPRVARAGAGHGAGRGRDRGGGLRALPLLLHTADAHGLYRHFGFAEPDDPTLMQRPAP